MLNKPLKLLVLGASYGLAAGIRAAVSGHHVDFVCLPDDAALINSGLFTVQVKARNADRVIELKASDCPRAPQAFAAQDIRTEQYDLALLAMQEPQYAADGLTNLVQRLIADGVPCISIMNMPLPVYLEDRLGIDITPQLSDIWYNTELWLQFDPALFTATSPDPQAIRRPADGQLLIEVTLPTNFKAAPFRDPLAQAKLKQLADDINAVSIIRGSEKLIPGVRLVAHQSAYVPLAKWPMLITGNFRCFRDGPAVSIGRAVNDDLAESESLYNWVGQLSAQLIGEREPVDDQPFVAFDRYANAARSLSSPSSIARGLANGATKVERVDKLVQHLGAAVGQSHPSVDAIVKEVDRRLIINGSEK